MNHNINSNEYSLLYLNKYCSFFNKRKCNGSFWIEELKLILIFKFKNNRPKNPYLVIGNLVAIHSPNKICTC